MDKKTKIRNTIIALILFGAPIGMGVGSHIYLDRRGKLERRQNVEHIRGLEKDIRDAETTYEQAYIRFIPDGISPNEEKYLSRMDNDILTAKQNLTDTLREYITK